MAERRMFAKSVINSARFLRMPPSSRLLYYDLGMAADDDGVVEAFTVMRTTGATEDDLRVLASKGFVRVLNDDFVSLITDWRRNNLIRGDRYQPSVYGDLLVQVEGGTQMEPTWNPSGTSPETSGKPFDNQLETNGKPMVNQRLTQVRLGKDRLGKDREGEEKAASAAPPPKPQKHKCGAYGNVLLSDNDLDKLKAEFPQDYQQRIERLSEYKASTGKPYKSDLATIRAWARRDKAKQGGEQPAERVFTDLGGDW